MQRIANDKKIEEDLKLLRDARDKFSVAENTRLNEPIINALMDASNAYLQISAFGRDKISKLKDQFATEIGNLHPDATRYHSLGSNFYSHHIKDHKTIEYDILKCAAIVLNTYKILIGLQEEVDKFRRLKTLDDIFGEEK
jgi:hypothetical protein